jgi:hypothetical protein
VTGPDQWAADLATDVSAPLVLAHVVEPVLVSSLWDTVAAEFEDERVASGRRMLSSARSGQLAGIAMSSGAQQQPRASPANAAVALQHTGRIVMTSSRGAQQP